MKEIEFLPELSWQSQQHGQDRRTNATDLRIFSWSGAQSLANGDWTTLSL